MFHVDTASDDDDEKVEEVRLKEIDVELLINHM